MQTVLIEMCRVALRVSNISALEALHNALYKFKTYLLTYLLTYLTFLFRVYKLLTIYHSSIKAELCDWCCLSVCLSVCLSYCGQDNTRKHLQMLTKHGWHGQGMTL